VTVRGRQQNMEGRMMRILMAGLQSLVGKENQHPEGWKPVHM